MDKSCDSTTTTATTTSSSSGGGSNGNANASHYLKQLNKLSHKISKPTVTATTVKNLPIHQQQQPPQGQNGRTDIHQPQLQGQNGQSNLHQHQPPVYNINKNDFRDVVQRLTGSPAHERIPAQPQPQTPPMNPSKPQNSRLQKIRPPPLAHLSNNRPPLLHNMINPNPNPLAGFIPRPTAPLSPLPPLPPVHAAAESPVSAYMRFLQSSFSSSSSSSSATAAVDQNSGKPFAGFSPLAPLVSPRWYQTNPSPPPQPQQQQLQENIPPPSRPPPQQQQPPPTSVPAAPPQLLQSPLAFGCLNSPSFSFSPNSSQLGFPLSPTVPAVPSPKYKGL